MSEPKKCRCGHAGGDQHPCHYAGYSCRKPATQRFYGAYLTSLAGVQMKAGLHSTWACDEHWIEYQRAYRVLDRVLDEDLKQGKP